METTLERMDDDSTATIARAREDSLEEDGRLRDDVLGAPVGIRILRGPDLAITFVNDVYLQLEDLGLDDARERSRAIVARGQAQREVQQLAPERGEARGRAWAISRTPVRGGEGDVDRAMTICLDITDLVAARGEAELTRQSTAMVVHDLRDPLAAIRCAAELVVRRAHAADPTLGATFRRVATSAMRMETLLDRAVDIAYLAGGGRLPLTCAEVDLAALAHQAATEHEDRHPDRVRIQARGGLVGTWDAARLIEMLSNLLSNALVHGARDAPVDVSLDGTAVDGVTLAVHNHGAIAADRLATLFEPFGGGSRGAGRGLGLFITRHIVTAHGGAISCRSLAGITQFDVRLPRVVARR